MSSWIGSTSCAGSRNHGDRSRTTLAQEQLLRCVKSIVRRTKLRAMDIVRRRSCGRLGGTSSSGRGRIVRRQRFVADLLDSSPCFDMVCRQATDRAALRMWRAGRPRPGRACSPGGQRHARQVSARARTAAWCGCRSRASCSECRDEVLVGLLVHQRLDRLGIGRLEAEQPGLVLRIAVDQGRVVGQQRVHLEHGAGDRRVDV